MSKPILSRDQILEALTMPGLNVEASLEPREVGLLCMAISDLLEKVCGEPVAWECRHFNAHENEWESWERLEVRNPRTDTIHDRVNEIRDYIKHGYKYELRALFALTRSKP